jgi:hypothetical protein
MTSTMKATFSTRREAELVVERLVQEFDIPREAIAIAPEGDANSAGEGRSGGDAKAAEPSVNARTDAPLESRIVVIVEPGEGVDTEAVRRSFQEFDGSAPA